MTKPPRPRRRLLRAADGQADEADHYAAAVYGSIVAAALIEAFRAEHVGAEEIALSVLATLAVFWLAHVWSAVIADRINHGPNVQLSRVKAISRAEWPLVEASFVPIAILLLGWAGVLSDAQAAAIALGVCIVQLVTWGVVVGRRAYGDWMPAAVVGIVNGALGLVLIELEVLVLH
jgi:hypothetical protein